MSYATNTLGGWRAVDSQDSLLDGEIWSEGQPPQPAVSVNEQILAQIRGIESATMVPRIVREMMLIAMVDKAIAVAAMPGETHTAEQLLAGNTGYVKVKAVDDQIKALRASLV